jgi:hypothetical protein
VDAAGQLVYQVVRFEPKDFRQRRPDGQGGWAWDLRGVDRVLYRLPEVLAEAQAGETVWVVEGEKDAEALRSAGIVATTAAQGAKAPWLDGYTKSLRGAREVVVVADADQPGYARGRVVRDALQAAGLNVRVVRAAQGKDAADHLAAGLGLNDFAEVPDEELDGLAGAQADDPLDGSRSNGKVHDLRVIEGGPGSVEVRARAGCYYATAEGLWRVVQTDEGPRHDQLTTCDVELVDAVSSDWGDGEYTVDFDVAIRHDGHERVVRVDSVELTRLDQVLTKSGFRGASIAPRQSAHAAMAMHALSPSGPPRLVYPHLGWREVDGKWLYLHGAGAIGPDGPVEGIQVEPPALTGYGLPAPLSGPELTNAVIASLEALLPCEAVMTTLLGAVWRSVLPALPPASLHLTGRTGLGKTALVKVALAHFGPEAQPKSWVSTANLLELTAWAAAGHVLVLDDFVASDEHQRNQMEGIAERLLRGAANHMSRDRMRADGKSRPNRPPRAFIVSTGEDVPGQTSQSQRARVLICEMTAAEAPLGPRPDPGRRAALEAAQAAAADGVLAAVTASYATWLARLLTEEGMAQVKHRIEADEHRQAERWATKAAHARTAPAIASLATGWSWFISWAQSEGILPPEEVQQATDAIYGHLDHLAETQANYLREADPVEHWVSLLRNALRSGLCYVSPRNAGALDLGEEWGWHEGDHKGDHIGWVDANGVYLLPDATYRVIAKMTRDSGTGWAWTKRATWSRLLDRGLILPGGQRYPFTPRINIDSRREYVLHVKPDVLVELAKD